MRSCRQLLSFVLMFALAGAADADEHANNLWVSVVQDRTGYPVQSKVGLLVDEHEMDSYQTDGCGNLVVEIECNRKQKFKAEPTEVNYFNSKPKKCRLRGNRLVSNIKIKVKKKHPGKKQLVHRSIITMTIEGSKRQYWYEYEWVAAALLSQRNKKCSLRVDVKQNFMDITDEEWDRENVRAVDQSFPEHFNPRKKEWRVVIPCSNVKTVQDIIAGGYDLFVREFHSRMKAERKSFIKLLGGSDFQPKSCGELLAAGNRG